MSDTTAQRNVLEALEGGGAIAPYGTSSAQYRGSWYGVIPPKIADSWGLQVGSELVHGYHPETRTLLTTSNEQPERPAWAQQVEPTIDV